MAAPIAGSVENRYTIEGLMWSGPVATSVKSGRVVRFNPSGSSCSGNSILLSL